MKNQKLALHESLTGSLLPTGTEKNVLEEAHDLRLSRAEIKALTGKPLSPENEFRLIMTWKRTGCPLAQQAIILSYKPLSIKVIRKLKVAPEIFDDLMQEACFGLMKALERFEPERGFRFGTYAIWWIRSEVQTALSTIGSQSAGMTGSPRRISAMSKSAKAKAISKIREEGLEENPDTVAIEMARIIGISVKKLQEHELSLRTVSLHTRMDREGEDGGEMIDLIPCQKTLSPETDYIDRQITSVTQAQIHEMLNLLSEREAEVIKARIYTDEKEKSLREIGDRYNLTPERIRQIEGSALKKLEKMAKNRRLQIHIGGGDE